MHHTIAAMERQHVSDLSARSVCVSRRQAAVMLGVSLRTIATLVTKGELRSVKIGARRVVPISAIEELITIRSKKGSTT
jgi:excisionase family DNA binding protein